jgi:hypothetical protein
VVKHFGLIVLVLGVLVGCHPAETPAPTPIDMPGNTDQVSWIRAYDDDGNRLTPFEYIVQTPDDKFNRMLDRELWYFKRELSEEQLGLLPAWRRERIVNADPDLDESGLPIIPINEPMLIRDSEGHAISVFEYLNNTTPDDIRKHPQSFRDRLLVNLSVDELNKLDSTMLQFLREEQ